MGFLEENPQYSRVSHNRKIINEKEEFVGYDVKPETLGTTVTMQGFLDGQLYSDFGSVYRNYFKQAGSKYNSLFLASRNVCDFQDMFITQDFGPVYVMDRVLSVYRSRSVAGATNYNSITSNAARRKDNIRLCRAVEQFYDGKYDLTPMIRRNQFQLLEAAVQETDHKAFEDAKTFIMQSDMQAVLPELIYLLLRGKNHAQLRFLLSRFNWSAKASLLFKTCGYTVTRFLKKIRHEQNNPLLRGYIVKVEK